MCVCMCVCGPTVAKMCHFGQLHLSRCVVFRLHLWGVCVCVCLWSYCCQDGLSLGNSNCQSVSVVLLLPRWFVFGQLQLSRCVVFRQGCYIYVVCVCVCVCVVLLLPRCVVFGQLHLSRCVVFRQGGCICVCGPKRATLLGRSFTLLKCYVPMYASKNDVCVLILYVTEYLLNYYSCQCSLQPMCCQQ